MASTRTFIISQPVPETALQFQPAMGTRELHDLIDAYIIANKPWHEKVSDVTLDFFLNATIDINTGCRTRQYDVFFYSPVAPLFEQSPAESQSSGFSPMFTPSPASSATFGDSGYGSFNMASMTPPSRTMGTSRVTKKAKKPAPKVDESRLPGFSIMTKDGIDVTTSAGRGIKTKEQRDHAHLMRIMKACDACRRKKIKCDPSHRRANQTDMSRTTSTAASASGSSQPSSSGSRSSSSRSPALAQTLSRESTIASSSTAFTPSTLHDDFVLFDDAGSFNASDMSQVDLGQYNFDINAETDLNNFPLDHYLDNSFFDQPFQQQTYHSSGLTDSNFNQHPVHQQVDNSRVENDFAIDQQPSNFQFSDFNVDDYLGQQGFDQSQMAPDSFGAIHTRPHPSGSGNDSGQLEPSSSTYMSWSQSQAQSQFSTMNGGGTHNSTPLSATSDWNLLESTMLSDSPAQSQTSTPGSLDSTSRSSEGSSQSRQHIDDNANRRAINSASIEPAAGILVDPSDILDVPLLSARPLQPRPTSHSRIATQSQLLSDMESSCQQVSASLRAINSSRSEYIALSKELAGLTSVLQVLKTRQTMTRPVVSEVRTFHTQLQILATRLASLGPELQNTPDPEFYPEYLRECQVQARRLVRSLCATINTVQALNSGTHSTRNERVLTSGRNLHLFSPETDDERLSSTMANAVQMWVKSTMDYQISNGVVVTASSPGDEDKDSRHVDGSSARDLRDRALPATGTLSPSLASNASGPSLDVEDDQAGSNRPATTPPATSHDARGTVTFVAQGDARGGDPAMSHPGTAPLQPTRIPDRAAQSMLTSSRSSQPSLPPSPDRSAQYVGGSPETLPATQASSSSAASANLQAAVDAVSRPATTTTTCASTIDMIAFASLPARAALSILVAFMLFCAAKMSTLNVFASIALPCVYSFRNTCNEWVGSDSLVAAVKLVFCAVLMAQAPALMACSLRYFSGTSNFSRELSSSSARKSTTAVSYGISKTLLLC